MKSLLPHVNPLSQKNVQLTKTRQQYANLCKKNERLRTERGDAMLVAKQQTSIAKGWQAHYEQLRDMRDANAVA